MKKTIRLTENKLNLLIKKVIKESLLSESRAAGLNRGSLENTYKNYNELGSFGTFNEVFKNEREKGIKPYVDFENGCATKVSLALNSAGQPLDGGFMVQNGPFRGKHIHTSAKSLKDELLQKFGPPDVKIVGVKSLEEVQNKIGPGKSGVYICTPCGFTGQVTGHATIWSWWKNNKKGGPLDDTSYPESNSGTVYFWQVGGTNELTAKQCGYNSWEEYKAANFVCKN